MGRGRRHYLAASVPPHHEPPARPPWGGPLGVAEPGHGVDAAPSRRAHARAALSAIRRALPDPWADRVHDQDVCADGRPCRIRCQTRELGTEAVRHHRERLRLHSCQLRRQLAGALANRTDLRLPAEIHATARRALARRGTAGLPHGHRSLEEHRAGPDVRSGPPGRNTRAGHRRRRLLVRRHGAARGGPDHRRDTRRLSQGRRPLDRCAEAEQRSVSRGLPHQGDRGPTATGRAGSNHPELGPPGRRWSGRRRPKTCCPGLPTTRTASLFWTSWIATLPTTAIRSTTSTSPPPRWATTHCRCC